jgi:hypothetical protein
MVTAAAKFIAERLSYAVVMVVGLTMVVVAALAADSALNLGALGFGVDDAGTVTSVDPRLAYAIPPTQRIQVGDRLELRELAPAQRFQLYDNVRVGAAIPPLPFERNGRRFSVTVTPIRADTTEVARSARFIGLVIGFIAVIGLASLVFLANPRVATLGFYCYALVMLVKTYQTTLVQAPWPFGLIGDLVVQVCYPLAQVLILLFAMQIFGVRERTARVLLWLDAALGVLVFFGWTVPILQQTFDAGTSPGWWGAVTDFAQTSVALAGLAYVARVAHAPRRQVAVVVIGVSLPLLNDFTYGAVTTLDIATRGVFPLLGAISAWTDILAPWFGPIGVALVCYGLVLSHIVGFRSAVARTAVATLATVSLLALFELIDYAVEKITGSESNDYSKIVALLISGFVLRLAHHRVDEFVTHVLFRRRHEDARALREAGEALACASSPAALRELLLAEPCRILRLPGAALLLLGDDRARFARTATAGVRPDAWVPAIAADGVLAARLFARRHPLSLDPSAVGDEACVRELFVAADHTRVVAIPVILRGDIGGVVVYEDRHDDAPLDAEEIHHLCRLAIAGAAALDHIDAVHSRELLDRALHRESPPTPLEPPAREYDSVRKSPPAAIHANDRPSTADTSRSSRT